MSQIKKIWQRIWQPMKAKWLLGIPIGGFFAVAFGIGGWLTFDTVMHATNENEFCYSCHIGMDTIVEEYQESVHFKNKFGVQAGCSDCHVPKEFFPKMWVKIKATKDVYHMIAGTVNLENFEEKRNHMAETVYDSMKSRDSKECKNCHNPDDWDKTMQPARAAKRHDQVRWAAKDETCVDCHQGIAHNRPVIK